MARIAGSDGRRTKLAIRKAGLQLIYQYGYEAVGLRMLANRVGLHQASLYNHIKSKQLLLFDLIHSHLRELLQAVEAYMLAHASGDPVDDLKSFIRFDITFHLDRKHEVFISHSELRSLSKKNRDVIMSMRQQYEKRLFAIISAGIAAERFRAGDARAAGSGILSILAGIPSWYDPGARLLPTNLSVSSRTSSWEGSRRTWT